MIYKFLKDTVSPVMGRCVEQMVEYSIPDGKQLSRSRRGICYNTRIRPFNGILALRVGLMRTQIAELFHETVNFCFNAALEGMGSTVRDVIYDYLEKRGISRNDISYRFDDVVQLLTQAFGSSARIIIYKTVVEIHREYSLRTDFTYQDPLRERIAMLKDRIVADHLYPKRAQKTDPFLETPRAAPLVQSTMSVGVRTNQ